MNVLKSDWNRDRTEETIIIVRNRHGRVHLWRPVGEIFFVKSTQPIIKNFQRGIMVWASSRRVF